jgi:hypothetical protein
MYGTLSRYFITYSYSVTYSYCISESFDLISTFRILENNILVSDCYNSLWLPGLSLHMLPPHQKSERVDFCVNWFSIRFESRLTRCPPELSHIRSRLCQLLGTEVSTYTMELELPSSSTKVGESEINEVL